MAEVSEATVSAVEAPEDATEIPGIAPQEDLLASSESPADEMVPAEEDNTVMDAVSPPAEPPTDAQDNLQTLDFDPAVESTQAPAEDVIQIQADEVEPSVTLDLEIQEDVAEETPLAEPVSAEPAPAEPNPMRGHADADALLEVDTLLAFENYDQAEALLQKLLADLPENPEYRLRLLHARQMRGEEAESANDEALLAEMMDGPLSETIARVREVGRDMLPGHHLFTSPEHEAERRTLDDFNQAFGMEDSPSEDEGQDAPAEAEPEENEEDDEDEKTQFTLRPDAGDGA